MSKFTAKLILFLLGCVSMYAQLATTQTTLSTAIPVPTANQGTTYVVLASCTGTVLPSVSAVGSYLAIDKEFFQVTNLLSGTIGGSATCTLGVKAGQLGSVSVGHSTTAYVFVSNQATGTGDNSRPFSGGAFVIRRPSGTCTASLQYSLPVIVTGLADAPGAGDVFGCNGGNWSGGPPAASAINLYSPLPLHGAVTAPQTDITDISGQEWFTSVYVPQATYVTGCGFLQGTATTDNILCILWDSSGVVVANSALAGTTGTASIYNFKAFTAQTWVYPGIYFVGIQGNGTTAAQFWAYGTGDVQKNLQTGIVAAGTFGTVINIPSASLGSFTTAKGPIVALY